MIAALTESLIADYQLPDDIARMRIWDTDVSGFSLLVGRRSKVFVCRYRDGARKIDRIIGHWPICSLANARRIAIKFLASTGKTIRPSRRAGTNRTKPKVGHVYAVMIGNNLVKVGYTENLDARVSTFRTSNPFAEVIGSWPGSRDDERRILQALPGRVGSSEVFTGDPAVLVKTIGEMISGSG